MWPFNWGRKTKGASAGASKGASWGALARHSTESLSARIDSLANNPSNAKHWAGVEALSADAMFDHDHRKRVRDRARHERLNNTYCSSLVTNYVQDVVGTGPRLNILSERSRLTSTIEKDWREWSAEINLPEKMRAFCDAKIVDGESFFIKITNPKITGPVQLDLSLIEAERVRDDVVTSAFVTDPKKIDGVTLDDCGNPVSYRVLKEHPGNTFSFNSDALTYAAEDVIHWFRRIRAEQHRGLSELSSALPLFAYLRRYTLAVIANAETTANFSAVMYTDMPTCNQAHGSPFEIVDVERNAIMTLPEGYKLTQFKPEQPGSSFEMFKREILSEIGRSIGVPVNIMTGDSARHNYSSARMDQQSYRRTIAVDRKELEIVLLRNIFRDWWKEYAAAKQFPKKLGQSISWFWDGFLHVDPKKEAEARKVMLESGLTNLSIEYAQMGYDAEDQIRQRIREKKLVRDLKEELGMGRE